MSARHLIGRGGGLQGGPRRQFWKVVSRVISIIAVVAACLAPQPGEARPRKPPLVQLSPAEKLTEQGLQALTEKDYSRAYAALSEAFRLAPSAEGLLHLGRLATVEQRNLEAQDLLRRYLLDPARKPDEPMAQLVQGVIAGPLPPAGRVIVLADPGALVSVDERLVGVLPLPSPLLLSPGDHRLVIEYPNKRLSGQVAISAGRQFEVRFDRGTGTLLVSLLPAILTVNDLGTTLPEAQSDLATTIEQSVRSVEQTVLPVDQALLSAPHLRDCTGKANCQQLLAQKVDVEYILHASLRRMDKGEGYSLKLAVRHRDITDPAAAVETKCPRCTPAEVVNLLGRTLPSLLSGALKRKSSTLTVTTQPVSAEVLSGKSRLGMTPLRRLLWAEPIQLTVRAAGYRPVHTEVTLPPTQTLTLDLSLEPLAQTVVRTEKPKIPVYRRWWLWTGVGVAAAAVATGLVLGLVPMSHDKVGWLP